MRIGLIGAMPMEVEPYLHNMNQTRVETDGPFDFHVGRLCGADVIVLCGGVGKVNAAMGAQALIQCYAPDRVIHAGVGGSLTKALGVCDVAVAEDCVQYDVDTSVLGDPVGLISTIDRIRIPADAGIREALLRSARRKGVRAVQGTIATGDRFLTSSEEKRIIVDRFGALTCDQESCAVAQVCYRHRVPFGVLRTVSDASDGEHGEEFAHYAARAAMLACEIVMDFLGNIDKA